MDDFDWALFVAGGLLAFLIDGDFFFKNSGSVKKKRRRPRWWVREWIKRRSRAEHNTTYKLQLELVELKDHAEFKSMLRMDEATYQDLLERVRPHITKKNTKFRRAIPVEERLTLTLDYLAHGGSNVKLSHNHRLGRSSIGRIIRETCTAIHLVLKDEYLKTPTDARTWFLTARLFETRWNFPHCLGALDGKHFNIYPPDNSGSKFFNYKGSFSIVMLALVNANYEFTYMDVGCEGRVADGGVWRDCDFRSAVENGRIEFPPPSNIPGVDMAIPYVIVADDAFPLGPYMMKPFAKRGLSHREEIFNYRLSRARRISENAFGILVNRFRVFLSNIFRTPETVEAMILASSALHNFLRKRSKIAYILPTDVDHEDAEHQLIEGTWRRSGNPMENVPPDMIRNPKRYAKEVRENLADHFVSPEGSVEWQDDRVKD